MLDGVAGVTIVGRGFPQRTGDAIVLPAGQPHAVKALSRFKVLLTMIRV